MCPQKGSYREILNSDDENLADRELINKKALETMDQAFHGRPYSIKLSIPPFGISVLRPDKTSKGEEGQ